MKIKITRATVAGGRRVSEGSVLDVDAHDGMYLIAIGKAEEVDPVSSPVPDLRAGPTCKACGKPFEKRGPRQVYCSPECRP